MKKEIAIIGGGPAAFILADTLDSNKFQVTIYERNKTLGRKFLVAGKGGFNLTHSENINVLIQRYTPADFLQEALENFDNVQLRSWLNAKGIPTFVGSSKRIFPEKGIKPIEVLQAILNALTEKNVKLHTQMKWTGWGSDGALVFNDQIPIKADKYIFALGGGSWKITGSDGNWRNLFEAKNIKTQPFLSANCACQILWEKDFLEKTAGLPLKNIAVSCQNKIQNGEAVITDFGLEGNAIYALSPQIQQLLTESGEAKIQLDLKPMLSASQLIERLEASSHLKLTDRLRKIIKLGSAQINLLKTYLSKEEFMNTRILSQRIKNLPLKIVAAAPVDEAISTTGGIDLNAVNQYYELEQLENHYCIGEMLDWNAPTGGYLLQACFSMGRFLGDYLNEKE